MSRWPRASKGSSEVRDAARGARHTHAMARRTRKPWNADKVLFPELQGEPRPAPPPAPERVPLTPSMGLVHSPRYEKTQPAPAKPEEEKPAVAE